ncbi:unnamed protein product, partial [Lampetra planeri]
KGSNSNNNTSSSKINNSNSISRIHSTVFNISSNIRGISYSKCNSSISKISMSSISSSISNNNDSNRGSMGCSSSNMTNSRSSSSSKGSSRCNSNISSRYNSNVNKGNSSSMGRSHSRYCSSSSSNSRNTGNSSTWFRTHIQKLPLWVVEATGRDLGPWGTAPLCAANLATPSSIPVSRANSQQPSIRTDPGRPLGRLSLKWVGWVRETRVPCCLQVGHRAQHHAERNLKHTGRV